MSPYRIERRHRSRVLLGALTVLAVVFVVELAAHVGTFAAGALLAYLAVMVRVTYSRARRRVMLSENDSYFALLERAHALETELSDERQVVAAMTESLRPEQVV